MENQDNQRKIYIRSTKQWVPVTEEIYREYYRPIWRLQKEAQKNGQCVCPKSKLWICDSDCATCEYRAAGNTISLDAPMENADGDGFSLIDTIDDPTSNFSDTLVDRLLLEQLSTSCRSVTLRANASANYLWRVAPRRKWQLPCRTSSVATGTSPRSSTEKSRCSTSFVNVY